MSTGSRMVYETLNLILVIVGLSISISIPFIMRGYDKRDFNIERIQEENDRHHHESDKRYDMIVQRLDKYEERLRLAEMEIIRNNGKNR